MTRVIHLVVGPATHGVVRHALHVARSCAHEVLRAAGPEAVALPAAGACDVVHVAFTDRLFADTGARAAAAFVELAGQVRERGARVSVTLHDVPRGDSDYETRRRAVYADVVAAADGVVACSRTELAAVEPLAGGVHSLRMIALPVDAVRPPPPSPPGPADRDVTVLGFVFPDRGYEQVLAELPAGSGLQALGCAARGHADLPARLAAQAAALGRRWRLTGFVPDAELGDRLVAAAVPVAPNPRVGASGSINSWLAHGRRPLVPRTDYTRELDGRMPGALWLYDAERPGALGQAVAQALADPSSTWLPAGTPLAPGTAEVAAAYRRHFAALAPPAAVPRPGGGVPLVPGNRWDLVPAPTGPLPPVSVVVPYYADQRRLDLVLAALAGQGVADRLEIVVADDGSPQPPDLAAAAGVPVRAVTQEHRGFGAARARNIGARTARHDLLVFLDADTVPDPDFVARLAGRVHAHPDVLAVGRRRHATFDGWSAADVAQWQHGRRPGPPQLEDPAWLRDRYAASRDLLDAVPGDYRYVISAVLGMSRSLFERLGGFDERFDRYGGEDWELANRAWHAGALLAHEPAARAWHDGPDWGARDADGRRAAKNAETLTLSRLLPDPELRGAGAWLPYPHVAVRLHVSGDDPDGGDHDPNDTAAGALLTARSALAAGVDCGCWLDAPVAADLAHAFVHAGPVPPDVLARAAVVVDVHAPCDLADLAAVAERAQRHGVVHAPALTAWSTRALARCGVDDALVERLFGRHDAAAPRPIAGVWLERDLPRAAQPVRRS